MFQSAIYLTLLYNLSNPNPNLGISDIATKSSVVVVVDITLAKHSFSLDDRYEDEYVNSVFKDNILLTLNYMSGDVKSKTDINWGDIEKAKSFQFTLKPGEAFAFHDQVLPEYKNSVVKTTNAHFNYINGFKSDGHLIGDGVCHLASLMYWVAKEAGLHTYAPTNHDFAKINDVPEKYGVSIYDLPGNTGISSRQNLYIKNNLDYDIDFIFDYDGKNLMLKVEKLINIEYY